MVAAKWAPVGEWPPESGCDVGSQEGWKVMKRPKIRESVLAHRFLDGLNGLEIGGAAGNAFGLNTKNVDLYASMDTIYKKAELDHCGEALPVDIVARGDELPVTDESQDFIISSHVLEHIPDPIKALKEWHRVIRPGGYIFMIVPHKERTFDKERPRTPLLELVHRHEAGYDPNTDAHHSVWVTEDMVDLVNYLGWRIVAVQDVDDKVGNGFTVVIQKQRSDDLAPPAPLSSEALEKLLQPLSPKYPASAVWAKEIELVGLDVTPVGDGNYEVAAQYRCLRRPKADYAMGLHLVPTNTAVLTPEVPLAVPAMGVLLWDCAPHPPTSAWEPRKHYRVAAYGIVPPGGGPWSIKIGFYSVADGKVVEIKTRTDAGSPRQTIFQTEPMFIYFS